MLLLTYRLDVASHPFGLGISHVPSDLFFVFPPSAPTKVSNSLRIVDAIVSLFAAYQPEIPATMPVVNAFGKKQCLIDREKNV